MKQQRLISVSLSLLLLILQLVLVLPQGIQAAPYDNSQGDILLTEKMNGKSGYFVGRNYDIPYIELWRYAGGTLSDTAQLYHVENLHAQGKLDFLAHGFCVQQDVFLTHFRVDKGGAYSYDWTSSWSKGNPTTNTMLSRIAYYGWESSNLSRRAYAGTQGAIWTYLGGAESHHFLDLAGNNLQPLIEDILHKARSHKDIPVFTGEGWDESTRTLKMKAGESIVLSPTAESPDITDSQLKSVASGISVSTVGNTLVVKSEPTVDTSRIHSLTISRINPDEGQSSAFLEHIYSQDVMFSKGIDPAEYTINIEFEASGQLAIAKTDEDTGAFLDGAEFQLLKENGSIVKVAELSPGHYTAVGGTLEVIKTHGGKASVEGLPAGNYNVKEIKVPTGYATPENDTHAVVVQDNHLSSITITNRELSSELIIYKTDQDTDARIPISGIRFSLYRSATDTTPVELDGNTVFTTDSNGHVALSDLKSGTYFLEELEAPEGYVLPEGRVEIALSPGTSIEVLVRNNPQMGRIKIEKSGPVLTGYTFEEILLERPVTDQSHAVVVEVPQFFEEVIVPDETSSISDEAGTDETEEFANPSEADQPVTDSSSSFLEPEPTASPEIAEGLEQPTEFTSEETIVEETSIETESTESAEDEMESELSRYFNLPISLSASMGGSVREEIYTQKDLIYRIVDLGTNAVVIPEVSPIDGILHLELFNGNYLAESINHPSEVIQVEFNVQEELMPEAYTLQKLVPQFTEGIGLRGAVFEIYADEDIYSRSAVYRNGTWDNILIHQAGALVDTVTTGDEGIALSKQLALGSYRIKEVKAPQGYSLNHYEDLVTLSYEGQQINLTQISSTYVNERQQLEVKFEKSFAESLWYKYHQEAPSQTLFGLYNIEAYTENGVTIPAGTLLATSDLISQDGKWIAEFNPFFAGNFEIRELHTNEAYLLSDPLAFVLEYKDNVEFLSVTLDELINELIRTDVEITKVDSQDNRPLAGVVFELIKINDDLTEEVIASYSTDETGKIHIDGLEYGRYILQEIVRPEGYASPKYDRHDVTVDASGQLIELRVENEPTTVRFTKLDFASGRELPGAHLSIRDSSGVLIEEWISTEEPHIIKRLKVGETYTLTEDLAPLGYATAQSIQFTILDTGEIQAVEMINDYTRIDIVKIDTSTDQVLPGASLRLLTSTGELIDEWVSTDEPHTVRGLEVGGAYIIEETMAPEGFVLETTGIDFIVEDLREVQSVLFKNEPTKVIISKQDHTTGEELPGAHLSLHDSSGNLIEEWISTDEPHLIEKLIIGNTYVLTENLAPLGYVTAESIEFTVQETGELQPVVMKDDITRISISKQDITTDKELPGAHLSLRDNLGNLVEEWISSDEPHLLEKLVVGETYTLTEDLAPLGFTLAQTIEFTVEDTGELQPIIMKDEPTTLLIRKVDPQGLPLAGAVFELTGVGAGPIRAREEGGIYLVQGAQTTFITDEAGRIEIHYLPVGEYELREVQAPKGYQEDRTVIELTMHENSGMNNPVEIIVTNQPMVPNVPSAGDSLYKYVVIAAMTMIGLASLIYGISAKRRHKKH